MVWDESSDRPKFVTSLGRAVGWVLNGSLCILFFAFCVFRFIHLLCQVDAPKSKIIHMVVETTCYSIPVTEYMSIVFCGQDIVDTVNLVVPFFRRYEGKIVFA